MKLRKWLQEHKGLSYAEYNALPDIKKWEIQSEHHQFCRIEQIHVQQNWRPMTAEENRKATELYEQERKRYETSLKIGGIDSTGNYTALHHRWK